MLVVLGPVDINTKRCKVCEELCTVCFYVIAFFIPCQF